MERIRRISIRKIFLGAGERASALRNPLESPDLERYFVDPIECNGVEVNAENAIIFTFTDRF